MKKIILIFTTVLALCMLSSCVVVAGEPKVVITPNYDITCYNNTGSHITDWCVKRNDHYTYANSDYNCHIRPFECDTIDDLPSGEYQIFFTFKARGKIHEYDYEETGTFYLDEDVTFYVRQRDIYGDRSAAASEEKEEGAQLELVCSNGVTYPLTKVEE